MDDERFEVILRGRVRRQRVYLALLVTNLLVVGSLAVAVLLEGPGHRAIRSLLESWVCDLFLWLLTMWIGLATWRNSRCPRCDSLIGLLTKDRYRKRCG